ncbi:2-succinylbenzoate--CoA ligase, chloroplastic/peroxisomal-like [Bidens hawaiensis]|uniref:2-succinylbenzoate--CoA ligase, chloroplastic/peroxisomal-like n=1 Tax=Bidens hawaiensis TaxID=980011 RepID=UPI00404A9A27
MPSEAHICQCLSRLYTFRRHSPVTIYGTRVNDGQQFVDGVLALACGLNKLGLKSGDVVAISAFNSDLYLEWLLAITFVGAIAATLNYRWSLEEAILAMKDVKPIMLVTGNKHAPNWHLNFRAHSVSSLSWHVLMDTDNRYNSIENNLTTNKLKIPSPRPHSFNYTSNCDGVAIVCFTSGTTGKPKGVMLSHSALIIQSLAKIATIGYNEDDVYLHTAPLGHVGGLSSALAMLMVGGCHVLMPKFEAHSALEAIEEYHVTSFITVPTIMSDMISLIRTKYTRKELPMVKKILNGGGSLSTSQIKDATDIFSNARLFTAYGMTEGCSSLTFMTLNDPTKQTTVEKKLEGVCVGKPAPHVELKIKTDDSTDVGEILTRGPHMMIGYWDQVQMKENHAWHETGDIGRIDNYGNLWLIGRMKGRIKSGGENIYPEEVESVILKHPGISATAVIGLPDNRLTEVVVVCVQLNHNWTWSGSGSGSGSERSAIQCISSETLQQFCRTNNLTGFKVPKRFIKWNNKFPLTTSGKLRRDQLKSEVMLHLKLISSSL